MTRVGVYPGIYKLLSARVRGRARVSPPSATIEALTTAISVPFQIPRASRQFQHAGRERRGGHEIRHTEGGRRRWDGSETGAARLAPAGGGGHAQLLRDDLARCGASPDARHHRQVRLVPRGLHGHGRLSVLPCASACHVSACYVMSMACHVLCCAVLCPRKHDANEVCQWSKSRRRT